jgi:hypothetical protein
MQLVPYGIIPANQWIVLSKTTFEITKGKSLCSLLTFNYSRIGRHRVPVAPLPENAVIARKN